MTKATKSPEAQANEGTPVEADRVERLMQEKPIARLLSEKHGNPDRTRDAIKYLVDNEKNATDQDIVEAVRRLLEPLRDRRVPTFFSYKKRDRDIATKIAGYLQDWTSGGLSIDHMEEIGAGDEWRKKIEQTIPDCICFLLLMPGREAERDWPLYEAGYFRPGQGLEKRLVCLHHPDNAVTKALGNRQSVPANPDRVERFLEELLHEPNWVPGMPALNEHATQIPEKAQEIVNLIRPPLLPRSCCGPHMEIVFDNPSAVRGWADLATGYVNEANEACRRLFDVAEGITPRSLGDWVNDVGGARRDEGWVLELAEAVRAVGQKRRVPDLDCVMSLPEGRFVRPKICAVTRRGDDTLQAVDLLFSEVGSPQDHSRMSPDFAALTAALEFAVEFRSVLERSARRRTGRENMRAFERALQTIERQATSDPRLASDPRLTRELTLRLFAGAQRDELEQIYDRWEQMRRPDAKGKLDEALDQLDCRAFEALVNELLELNQRFLVLVSARFSDLVRSPDVAWLDRRDRAQVQPQESPVKKAAPASLLSEIKTPSIAVLPFENMSDDPHDLFADGMTDAIISRLAGLRDLRVVSRDSVMAYRRTDKTRREIAEELHVTNILEGSVRRDESDRVRITARLIDAETDTDRWEKSYEYEGLVDDVFQVQSRVAERLITALNLELSPDERAALAKHPTECVKAYDYYLEGLDFYRQYSNDFNERAINLYKRALDCDPKYALAHAGLASAYYQRAARFGFPRKPSLEASQRESDLAIKLDRELAEGWSARGAVLGAKGLTEQALAAELKAVELKPSYLIAALNIGVTYSEMGRLDEALHWKKKAFALDPHSSTSCSQLGSTYGLLGMDDEALMWFQRALDLEPESVQANAFLAEFYLALKKDAEALQEAEKILARFPGEPMGLNMAGRALWFANRFSEAEVYFHQNPEHAQVALAHIAWQAGRLEEARELLAPALESLEKAEELGSQAAWVHTTYAAIHALREEKEMAYKRLEQAIEAGEKDFRTIQRLPVFAGICGEPRFGQLMEEMEKRVAEMRQKIIAHKAA